MHKATFHLRRDGISVHVDVAVAAADDVEVREITLHNETNRRRALTLTSSGRPVLLDAKKAAAHPAFSSMFVVSEQVAELDGLLFARRRQSAEEEPVILVHRLVREGADVSFAGYETDRGAFFGRSGSPEAPAALGTDEGVLRGRVGAVLDPMMSLMARVELAPKGSVTLAFVTTVGRSRSAAVETARKYGSMHAVRWAFRDAEQESPRRLQRAKVAPVLLATIQRLFSSMLFADPTLRPPSDARALVPPCQQRLWGRGISGDDPIVLVRVSNPDAPLLHETLAAQRYLRACGVRMDLVLVDEQATGYTDRRLRDPSSYARAERRRRVGQSTRRRLRDRRRSGRSDGGSSPRGVRARRARYARRLARRAPGTRRREPAQRCRGSSRRVADEPGERRRPRPGSSSTTAPVASPRTGGEYVLEVRPGAPTPAPWCNVLANPRVRLPRERVVARLHLVAQRGENRLTPWRNDPVFDTPSEALYLRDEETAAVWSPTPLPAGQRRTDARPPRRRIHDVRAREPWPRAGDDGLRAARRARSRSCAFG